MIAGKMAVKIEDIDSAEKLEKKTDWKSPLLWGSIVTLLYFVGFAVFVYTMGKGLATKLSLNEIGDFFAGAAAPLAFIWLVVAVFLQRRELVAQHETLIQQMEELKLSREEYKLNREILTQQGVVQRQQTESMNKLVSVGSGVEARAELDIKIQILINSFIDDVELIIPDSHPKSKGFHGSRQKNVDQVRRFLEKQQMSDAFNSLINIANFIKNNNFGYISFGYFKEMECRLGEVIEISEKFVSHYESYDINSAKLAFSIMIKIQKEVEKNNP